MNRRYEASNPWSRDSPKSRVRHGPAHFTTGKWPRVVPLALRDSESLSLATRGPGPPRPCRAPASSHAGDATRATVVAPLAVAQAKFRGPAPLPPAGPGLKFRVGRGRTRRTRTRARRAACGVLVPREVHRTSLNTRAGASEAGGLVGTLAGQRPESHSAAAGTCGTVPGQWHCHCGRACFCRADSVSGPSIAYSLGRPGGRRRAIHSPGPCDSKPGGR